MGNHRSHGSLWARLNRRVLGSDESSLTDDSNSQSANTLPQSDARVDENNAIEMSYETHDAPKSTDVESADIQSVAIRSGESGTHNLWAKFKARSAGKNRFAQVWLFTGLIRKDTPFGMLIERHIVRNRTALIIAGVFLTLVGTLVFANMAQSVDTSGYGPDGYFSTFNAGDKPVIAKDDETPGTAGDGWVNTRKIMFGKEGSNETYGGATVSGIYRTLGIGGSTGIASVADADYGLGTDAGKSATTPVGANEALLLAETRETAAFRFDSDDAGTSVFENDSDKYFSNLATISGPIGTDDKPAAGSVSAMNYSSLEQQHMIQDTLTGVCAASKSTGCGAGSYTQQSATTSKYAVFPLSIGDLNTYFNMTDASGTNANLATPGYPSYWLRTPIWDQTDRPFGVWGDGAPSSQNLAGETSAEPKWQVFGLRPALRLSLSNLLLSASHTDQSQNSSHDLRLTFVDTDENLSDSAVSLAGRQLQLTGTHNLGGSAHGWKLVNASGQVVASGRDSAGGNMVIPASVEAGTYTLYYWGQKDGTAADGWSNTATIPAQVNDFDVPSAHTVTFNTQSGTGASNTTTLAATGTSVPTVNDSSVTLEPPTKTGYTFGGYFDAAGGAGAQYYTDAMASVQNFDKSADATLYAKWTQDVSLSATDATVAGQTTASETYNAAPGQITSRPVRSGYSLLGWFSADTGGTKVLNPDGSPAATSVSGYITDSVWTHDGDAGTLYAQWENTHSITVTIDRLETTAASLNIWFDSADITGDETYEGASAYYRATDVGTENTFSIANIPESVSRGSVIAEYTTDGDYNLTTGEHIAESTGKNTDVTVATYESSLSSGQTPTLKVAELYTITYSRSTSPSGSTGGIHTSQTKIHDTEITLHDNTSTLAGYTQNSWNTAADGSATTYASGSYSTNASLNLYEHWTQNEHGITLTVTKHETVRSILQVWWDSTETDEDNTYASASYKTECEVGEDATEYCRISDIVYPYLTGSVKVQYTNDDTYNISSGTSNSNTSHKGAAVSVADITFEDIDTDIGRNISAQVAQLYSITYERSTTPNGSTDGDFTSQTKIHGFPIDLYANTSKLAGYRATGWNDAPDGTGTAYTGSYNTDASITLYEAWTKNVYSITVQVFKKETAQSTVHLWWDSTDTEDDNTYEAAEYKSEVTAPDDGYDDTYAYFNIHYPHTTGTLRAEYTGTGTYNLNPGETNEAVSHKGTVAEVASYTDLEPNHKRTYSAKLSVAQLYPISYERSTSPSGASGTLPDSHFKIHDVDATLGTNESTLDGYTSNGWYTTSTGTSGTAYANGATYSANSALTLYEAWNLDSYSITYVLNCTTDEGGSNPNTDVSYNVNDLNILFSVPTCDNYNFGGWFTKDDFDAGSQKTGIPSGSHGNVTVYAKWTYTITYHGNGTDSGVPAPQVEIKGSEITISSAGPTGNPGATFNGWNTIDDGSGTAYAAGQNVTLTGGHVTLYAVWSSFVSIEISGTTTGELKAYRLAGYDNVNFDLAGAVKNLQLKTLSGITSPALTAAEAAGCVGVDEDNPIGWVVQQWLGYPTNPISDDTTSAYDPYVGQLQLFAQSLAKEANAGRLGAVQGSIAAGELSSGGSKTLFVNTPGLFLIVDSTQASTGSLPIIVGTKVFNANLGTDGTFVDFADGGIKGKPQLGVAMIKSSSTALSKRVLNDTNMDGFEIGQKVDFQIAARVPNLAGFSSVNYANYHFSLVDEAALGLIMPSSDAAIHVYMDVNPTTGLAAVDTDVTDQINIDISGQTITISGLKALFAKAGSGGKVENNDVPVGSFIRVRYSASVGSNISFSTPGGGGMKPNVNTVTIDTVDASGASNTSQTAEAHVYSFQMDLLKVDKDDQTRFLEGAEFKVSREKLFGDGREDLHFVDTGDSVYRFATANEIAAGKDSTGADVTDVLVSQGQGNITIQGVEARTLRLKETHAPDDYFEIPAFTVDPTPVWNIDGSEVTLVSWRVSGTALAYVSQDGRTIVMADPSKTLINLPYTGGTGVMLLLLIAISITVLGIRPYYVAHSAEATANLI